MSTLDCQKMIDRRNYIHNHQYFMGLNNTRYNASISKAFYSNVAALSVSAMLMLALELTSTSGVVKTSITLPSETKSQNAATRRSSDTYQSLNLDLFDRRVQRATGRSHNSAGYWTRLFTRSHLQATTRGKREECFVWRMFPVNVSLFLSVETTGCLVPPFLNNTTHGPQ